VAFSHHEVGKVDKFCHLRKKFTFIETTQRSDRNNSESDMLADAVTAEGFE